MKGLPLSCSQMVPNMFRHVVWLLSWTVCFVDFGCDCSYAQFLFASPHLPFMTWLRFWMNPSAPPKIAIRGNATAIFSKTNFVHERMGTSLDHFIYWIWTRYGGPSSGTSCCEHKLPRKMLGESREPLSQPCCPGPFELVYTQMPHPNMPSRNVCETICWACGQWDPKMIFLIDTLGPKIFEELNKAMASVSSAWNIRISWTPDVFRHILHLTVSEGSIWEPRIGAVFKICNTPSG